MPSHFVEVFFVELALVPFFIERIQHKGQCYTDEQSPHEPALLGEAYNLPRPLGDLFPLRLRPDLNRAVAQHPRQIFFSFASSFAFSTASASMAVA